MTTLESAMTAYVEAVRDGTEGVTVEMAWRDAGRLREVGFEIARCALYSGQNFRHAVALPTAPKTADLLDALINAVCDQLAGGYEIGQSACALIRAAAEEEG